MGWQSKLRGGTKLPFGGLLGAFRPTQNANQHFRVVAGPP